MEKDSRAPSSSKDGKKREEKKKGAGDNKPHERTANPLWSTRPGAVPTPRVAPPLPGTADGGNPGSIYQHFFIDLKSCRCAEGQHKDFSSCQLSAEPLANVITRTLCRCLNCDSCLHSIFGCPDSLKAAVITWHPTNNPSCVGAVEFATDLQIGRYNIDGGQWQILIGNQQGQVADASGNEGEPVAKTQKKSQKSEKLFTSTYTLDDAQTSPIPPPVQPQPDSTRNTLKLRRFGGAPIAVDPAGFVPHSVDITAPLEFVATPYNTANPIQTPAVPSQPQPLDCSTPVPAAQASTKQPKAPAGKRKNKSQNHSPPKKRGRLRKSPSWSPEAPVQSRQSRYKAQDTRPAAERAAYPAPEPSPFQTVDTRSVGGRVEEPVVSTPVLVPRVGSDNSYLHEPTHPRPTTGTAYRASLAPSPFSCTSPQIQAPRGSGSGGTVDSRRGSASQSSSSESSQQVESRRFGSTPLTNSTLATPRGPKPDGNSQRLGASDPTLDPALFQR